MDSMDPVGDGYGKVARLIVACQALIGVKHHCMACVMERRGSGTVAVDAGISGHLILYCGRADLDVGEGRRFDAVIAVANTAVIADPDTHHVGTGCHVCRDRQQLVDEAGAGRVGFDLGIGAVSKQQVFLGRRVCCAVKVRIRNRTRGQYRNGLGARSIHIQAGDSQAAAGDARSILRLGVDIGIHCDAGPMISQRYAHLRRITHVVIGAVDRRRNTECHVEFRNVHAGGRRVMGLRHALAERGAVQVADIAVGIRLNPAGMVFTGGEIDGDMATAADFGGRVGLPVVDLVAGPQVEPTVGVANNAFLYVLGISDAAPVKRWAGNGVMNLVNHDRQVSSIVLHLGPIGPDGAVADDAGSGIKVRVGMVRFLKQRAVAFLAGIGSDKQTLGNRRRNGSSGRRGFKVKESDGIVGDGVAAGVVMAADHDGQPLGVGLIVVGRFSRSIREAGSKDIAVVTVGEVS